MAKLLRNLLTALHLALPVLAMAMASSSPPAQTKTVGVTGANGYLASHIVKQLLQKGHDVHACVRNADNASSVQHLLDLQPDSRGKLTLFSTGDMGDPSLAGRYDAPLEGCNAVIHAATPLRPKTEGEFDGMRDMVNPGMAGTQEMLDAILKCPTVKCLVLTSSMSAAAPVPEPKVKDESHWSDDAAQLARGNYYGCLKTRQERLCHDFVQEQIDKGALPKEFRFSAICPTMIIGPPVGADEEGGQYTPSGTMGYLHKWMTGGRTSAPNDSMSFVHVDDCAAMHVAAVENADARGRYFSLVESWHWNDILATMKELYPDIPLEESWRYEGEDVVVPTAFDLTRMHSLGVEVKSVRDILAESVEFFERSGALTHADRHPTAGTGVTATSIGGALK